MNKEKQIDEMAKDLCYNGGTCSLEEWNDCKLKVGEYCSKCKSIAERLINAGYRKQSEVIDEFAERLKEAPIKCGLPLLGLSTKDEIVEYFNGIMLQVRDAIDSIAEKMKGGAE